MLAFGQSSMIFAAENSSEAASVIRVGYTGRDQMIVKSGDIFSGYGVSYLQTIAAYTGWKYEYVLVTDENRMDKLKNGNIDLLCDVSMDEAESNSLLTSAENSCMHYALLCAKEDDASVFYNEYEAMNGKRIAVNTSRKMEHMMEEFAAEHHIEYTPVYCSSFAEMDAAVQKGRADLLVAASLRKLDGYKYVAKMGMRDQFFATSQKHPVLMEQLNRADRQIKIKQPFIIASLYEKFYGRPAETLVGMTREEYEFIQKKIPIRIVCDASNFPISYVDETTGKYSGVYADALTLIEEESGLHFQFMPLKNYKDSWKLLQSGEADMSANMYLTEDLKKTYGLLSSTPYLTSNFTMILRRDQTLEGALKVALPDNYKDIQEYVSTCYPKWQIVPAKNTNACLRMVENGDVDVTILNSIFLQTTYNLSNYSNLIVLPMHSLDIPISCAFSGPNAQLLCDIINKTIKRIPPESFENCIIDNSVKISYEPTMMDITKKVFPFLVLVFAIFIIIYLWTLWSRERHYRHLAMTDSVTGLWNGMYFRQKAGEILSGNRQNSYQLISMDIEHFKHVNTDFGEKTADSILRNMAARLRSLFGSDAVCAREMGDMFLILTQPKDDVIDGLLELGREIVFDNNGIEQHYKPDLKFGLYEISADTDRLPVNEYIDRAIAARKSVKRNPARQIAHYDQKMEEAISLEARIEKKMENALRNREFSVYYQPKYLLTPSTLWAPKLSSAGTIPTKG